MGPEIRWKIEETVLGILKEADMELMTEFKVRVAAAEQLGMDLSGAESKAFVRSVVEGFLLSGMEDNIQKQNSREEVQLKQKISGKEPSGDGIICKLSDKRNVAIQEFRGKNFVSIRDYYMKDGKQFPSPRGISMTSDQWSVLKNSIPAIEEAIRKMQSKLRSEHESKQTEGASNSEAANTEENIRMEVDRSEPQRRQNGDISTSRAVYTPAQGIIPIVVNRFDGKNYFHWVNQMKHFLEQLNVAYVLTTPNPGVSLSPEASAEETAQVKAAEEKWVYDDVICHHNILNSLSDHLFHTYSKKSRTARELWQELKLFYHTGQCGTRRSLVKMYLDFQMVDGKPILEQVQELNEIANFLVEEGMFCDEAFHVSAIICKLPPSWKDFGIKLMYENDMPFKMLMDRVGAEEEIRIKDQFGKRSNVEECHQSMRSMRKCMYMNKREMEGNGKAVVCFRCGKKGHLARHCLDNEIEEDVSDEMPMPSVTEAEDDRKALVCFRCGKKGHFARHCLDNETKKDISDETPIPSLTEAEDNRKAIVCFRCGKKGHFARYCPDNEIKKDISDEMPMPPATEAQDHAKAVVCFRCGKKGHFALQCHGNKLNKDTSDEMPMPSITEAEDNGNMAE